MSLTNLILQINLTASFYTSLNGKFWIQFVWIKFDDFVRKEVSSGNFVHWKLVQSQVLRHKSKPFIFKWKVQKLVSVKKEAVSCHNFDGVKTSPISFIATKEIGDVCTQASQLR